MLYPELEEKLQTARQALERATSRNIIEACKQYLALLVEYRSQLYKLQGTPGITRRSGPAASWEEIDKTRTTVLVAIENMTQERNRIAALLRSFTTVSGYEAVATFNERKYKGHDTWELKASGVRLSNAITDGDGMTIQEAVDAASLLRREEHIAHSAKAGATREPNNNRQLPSPA